MAEVQRRESEVFAVPPYLRQAIISFSGFKIFIFSRKTGEIELGVMISNYYYFKIAISGL